MSSPLVATTPPVTPTVEIAPSGARMAVLKISELPVRLRREVEALMLTHLDEQSQWILPGSDPLEAAWCTRWTRDAGARPTVSCDQILCAPEPQLKAFEAALEEGPGRFAASVELLAA